jgi:asparagine synthase (glutamine-hydrolysing)
MCGIAGIISTVANNDASILRCMLHAIAHRGPDGEANWQNPNAHCQLGHRRLAIIDTSAKAAQPMQYAGRYSIVHNGEIYNYKELRETLQKKGYSFNSASDTEVILAAYDCWQQDCLRYFDGMFAFAIWDEKEQQLFAVRDRFGEKPFYFSIYNGNFYFASEKKALWAAGIERHADPALIYNFFTLGYTANPGDASATGFRDIFQLAPASWLLYKPGQSFPRINSWWKLDKDKQMPERSDAAMIEEFAERLRDSVSKRLRSDVPLGTSLSGGLDSSAIAACICALLPAPAALQTFSAVFPGAPMDESARIHEMVNSKQLLNTQISPDAHSFAADLPALLQQHEGLVGSASAYIQYRVYRLAADAGVKVLLDGQGADEVLAGYPKYRHWYFEELANENTQALRQELAADASGWSLKSRFAARFPDITIKAVTTWRRYRQQNDRRLTASFLESAGESWYQLPRPGKLNNVLFYNTCENGLDELLRYADINSMACGRELRLPFLQHELVEFVFSLPARSKIRDGYSKWILRQSMKDQLPPVILNRKEKTGFEPPQRTWMQHAGVVDQLRDAKQKLVNAGILRREVLAKKNQPQDAYAADNFDWRCLSVAAIL